MEWNLDGKASLDPGMVTKVGHACSGMLQSPSGEWLIGVIFTNPDNSEMTGPKVEGYEVAPLFVALSMEQAEHLIEGLSHCVRATAETTSCVDFMASREDAAALDRLRRSDPRNN